MSAQLFGLLSAQTAAESSKYFLFSFPFAFDFSINPRKSMELECVTLKLFYISCVRILFFLCVCSVENSHIV